MASLQLPIAGTYSIPRGGTFGAPRGVIAGIDYGTHKGLDFAARSGTTVVAAGGGRVVHSAGSFDQHIGAGNHIHVEHGGGLETRYVHLLSRFVREGQMVAAGQPIGAVGSSGTATGPHLHFEVLVGGRHHDPARHLGLGGAVGILPAAGAAAPVKVCYRPEFSGGLGQAGEMVKVPVNADGTCPAGTHGPYNDVGDRPENPLGQAIGLALPPLLEPALNIAVIGGAALLVYRGVVTILKP